MPFIDDQLNIRVHPKAAGQAIFVFEDETGAPRNVQAGIFYFDTVGYRKRLTAGDETNHLVLTIEVGDVNHLMNKSTQYLILDETQGQTRANMILMGELMVLDSRS